MYWTARYSMRQRANCFVHSSEKWIHLAKRHCCAFCTVPIFMMTKWMLKRCPVRNKAWEDWDSMPEVKGQQDKTVQWVQWLAWVDMFHEVTRTHQRSCSFTVHSACRQYKSLEFSWQQTSCKDCRSSLGNGEHFFLRVIILSSQEYWLSFWAKLSSLYKVKAKFNWRQIVPQDRYSDPNKRLFTSTKILKNPVLYSLWTLHQIMAEFLKDKCLLKLPRPYEFSKHAYLLKWMWIMPQSNLLYIN